MAPIAELVPDLIEFAGESGENLAGKIVVTPLTGAIVPKPHQNNSLERNARMKTSLWIVSLLALTVLSGCSAVPERGAARTGYVGGSGPKVGKIPGVEIDLRDVETVRSSLYAHYDEWKGTRYQLGGTSKDAIDCS